MAAELLPRATRAVAQVLEASFAHIAACQAQLQAVGSSLALLWTYAVDALLRLAHQVRFLA